MTTIALKSGIMACDSSWTDCDDVVQTLHNKIVRLSSGALLGESGDNDSRHVHDLLDRVKCFDRLPYAQAFAECKVDYAAILAFQNGEVAIIEIEHNEDL